MRTEIEIIDQINHTKEHDFFGFGTGVLVSYLSYEAAQPFLRKDVTAEQWATDRFPSSLTHEALLKELSEYMQFAWSKVEDHRGISAQRSVQKLSAWVWLLGDDACLEKVAAAPYAQYGAPKLKVICDAFGLPVPDDQALQNMMTGALCKSDCQEGCGL